MKNNKRILVFLLLCLSIIIIFFLNQSYKNHIDNPNNEIVNDNEIINDNNEESIKDIIENNNELITEKKKIIDQKLLEELSSKVYYFAIFGTDERSDEIPRSDVIMIIKYVPSKNKVLVFSIPRDTRVIIPDRGLDKINHSYAFGGPELLKKTLENLLDQKIDEYIKLSFKNFEEIIDSIGGVKVIVKKDYKYPGYIDIKKGEQILSGEKALEYVRFRYDDQGDYGRIQRQQEIFASIFNWYVDLRFKTTK